MSKKKTRIPPVKPKNEVNISINKCIGQLIQINHRKWDKEFILYHLRKSGFQEKDILKCVELYELRVEKLHLKERLEAFQRYPNT